MEDVCKKQNLKPEEYDLKHHNKVLDTSAIFRFSGLPNNAQLELIPATKLRSETEIILALNLEDGKRLVGNFIPNDTLLSVLKRLYPDCLSAEKNPVVIFMRQEIYGTQLEMATLRSLGITGGRAMLRLIDKAPEELKVQANVATPLPHKPVEEKPYVRKIKESPNEISILENNTSILKVNDKNVKGENSQEIEKTNPDENKSNTFKQCVTTDIKLAKEKRKGTDLSSSQEKRQNISTGTSNKLDLVRKQASGLSQLMEVCECKKEESMEFDCCQKCEENCNNIQKDNIVDQFVFVSTIIFQIIVTNSLDGLMKAFFLLDEHNIHVLL